MRMGGQFVRFHKSMLFKLLLCTIARFKLDSFYDQIGQRPASQQEPQGYNCESIFLGGVNGYSTALWYSVEAVSSSISSNPGLNAKKALGASQNSSKCLSVV